MYDCARVVSRMPRSTMAATIVFRDMDIVERAPNILSRDDLLAWFQRSQKDIATSGNPSNVQYEWRTSRYIEAFSVRMCLWIRGEILDRGERICLYRRCCPWNRHAVWRSADPGGKRSDEMLGNGSVRSDVYTVSA